MIEYDGYDFDFVCDKCGDREGPFDKESEFRYGLEIIKELGWCVRKEHGEWTHTCPDCTASTPRGRRVGRVFDRS
jgi:hypothetical protein